MDSRLLSRPQLICRPASVILLGFGGNRFTASSSEGYFTNVLRIGVKLLFFYAVLAIGMQIVPQWESALAVACKPVVTGVACTTSYCVPPSKIMTTVCSKTPSTSDILAYSVYAITFAVITVAIPSMTGNLVGGTVGLALDHAFEPAYTGRTIARIVNPITSGLKKISEGIAGLGSGKGTGAGSEQSAIQSVLAQHQSQSSAETAPNAATKVFNPFDGQPPGYNYRGPNGAGPSPIGPALPPSPNGGSGSGGAALEYQPGKPGQHTKDIAVDVTGLQNGNGKGSS